MAMYVPQLHLHWLLAHKSWVFRWVHQRLIPVRAYYKINFHPRGMASNLPGISLERNLGWRKVESRPLGERTGALDVNTSLQLRRYRKKDNMRGMTWTKVVTFVTNSIITLDQEKTHDSWNAILCPSRMPLVESIDSIMKDYWQILCKISRQRYKE